LLLRVEHFRTITFIQEGAFCVAAAVEASSDTKTRNQMLARSAEAVFRDERTLRRSAWPQRWCRELRAVEVYCWRTIGT
jgi:hypothetical protein